MGEGWGEGEPPFILSPPPPFILSLSKDPLSLVGEGWGEGAYPQLTALFTSDSDQRS